MAKYLVFNDKTNQPEFIEREDGGKTVIMDIVDKLRDGIDGVQDWRRMGKDYALFVQQEYEHALAALDILIDKLKEEAEGCEHMQKEYARFMESVRSK